MFRWRSNWRSQGKEREGKFIIYTPKLGSDGQWTDWTVLDGTMTIKNNGETISLFFPLLLPQINLREGGRENGLKKRKKKRNFPFTRESSSPSSSSLRAERLEVPKPYNIYNIILVESETTRLDSRAPYSIIFLFLFYAGSSINDDGKRYKIIICLFA
jgi:hypothetical protein